MIDVLFLNKEENNYSSRVIDKALRCKFGDTYLGCPHAVLQCGAFYAEISIEGINYVYIDGDVEGYLLSRLVGFVEFDFHDAIDSITAEYKIVRRIQHEIESGEHLIEEELLQWYRGDAPEAYFCTNFCLDLLGIPQYPRTLTPHELFNEMAIENSYFVDAFKAANDCRDEAELRFGGKNGWHNL
jgi:hypothetical protein